MRFLNELPEPDPLTRASNAVRPLIKAGKLDEAEQAAQDLLQRFPKVHGYDRLGMVAQARGENLKAADYYRKAAAFIREHPDQYEPGYDEVFEHLVEKLDPSDATS